MTFQEIINQDKPILIDFFATWCGPCQMQGPIVDEVKQNMGDEATIIKIDIDQNRQLATQFQVRSVPTLMIFNKGELKWRQSGVFPVSELVALVKKEL
ncbi:MAG TPA: thioredoxin [Dysgonomonas sp.]|uniref:thioredoxin n=1 Tax=unclassified Dysgonomonas TaxID=2630389 RepID=UPI0025C52F45|nr:MULTISPECIES: thioredoxin [unclassified Dysgonomonas]HML65107.1 thioredoxin [Dysgonomonas sp.]